MREGLAQTRPLAGQITRLIQRQPEPEEEKEEAVQTKGLAGQSTALVQKQAEEEEEEPLQTKPLSDQITPLIQRQAEHEEEEDETVQTMSPSAQPASSIQRQAEPEKEEQEQGSIQTTPISSQTTLSIQRQEEIEEEEEEGTIQTHPISQSISPLIRRQEQREEEEEDTVQTKTLDAQITPLVQRQEAAEEEEEEEVVQRMPGFASSTSMVQHQGELEQEEEEPALQAKEISSQRPAATRDLESRIHAQRGGGKALPGPTRAFFEPRFGADLSQVRVHSDTHAAEAANAINAKAFTVGRNIAFGAGQYAPESREGRQLLAHELTHVVQQGSAKAVDASLIQRQEAAVERGAEEEDTGEAARRALEGTMGRAVRKPGRISREQFLRQELDPRKGENVVATLQFNNAVFVEAVGGKDGGWYKIVSEKGEQGWVPKVSVALEPPEPSAELYKVQPGDKAINLAGRWYGPPGGWKRWWWPGSDDAGDARFYVGALAFANKGRAGMPGPADLTKRDAWMQIRVIEGLTIWKPSKEFLRTLRGKVSSGSITKELWEDVKKVAKAIWEFVVFAAAFISGLLYGAGESIYDLFVGVVDLAKMAWSIGKSLITGNIISDAKKFWDDLQKIDIRALAEDFQRKWFAPDPWDAGFFQGRVLGYVIMEIVMLVASGGILTALKWAGKFAKIGALIAKLPRVAKVVKAVKGTKTAAKLRSALSKAATKGGKAFKSLKAAKRWAADSLKLNASILKDLTLAGINRLRTLPDWALQRLSNLSNRLKRIILGCASKCEVNLALIKAYLSKGKIPVELLEEATEYILEPFKILKRNRAVRNRVKRILRTGNIEPDLFAKVMNAAKWRGAKRILRYIERMAEKNIKGMNDVLSDLAQGGNKFRGAEWVLRYIDSRRPSLWAMVDEFEAFEDLGAIGRRAYDAVIGGIRYQFKSWREFYSSTFLKQIKKDVAKTGMKRLKWVFEARGELITKRKVIKFMKEALLKAVKEGKMRETTAKRIIDNLDDVVEVRKLRKR